MKLTIIVEILVLCLMLTLFTVFTLDAASVRKAELLSVMSTDVDAVCKSYFEGEIATVIELQDELENAVESSISSKAEDINIVIYKTDIENGIIELVVEITYNQPTGKPKTISMERIYRDV